VPLTHSSFNRANRVRLVREIGRRVDRVVTFVPDAGRFLAECCGLPSERVEVIWHGAPEFPDGHRLAARDKLGLSDRLVVTTFGLLTRFKGLDLALQALPELVQRHPNLLYLLLGRIHPAEGDQFFPRLQGLVRELGLDDHVRFVSHYLSDEEIVDYLSATDVYVTPYLDETQISSGTLTYALAAGCCCLSTDYIYARNALADGRGVIVPHGSSEALRDGLAPLLADEALRRGYAARARAFGRKLSWKTVADQFLDTLYRAAEGESAARNSAATSAAS
jgi:glycosyltransferase involved in cell wall biosynthesis